MLDNCTYDKVKLLHNLSCLLWFIDKHALKETQHKNDPSCTQLLKDMKADIEKHIAALEKMMCK